MNAAIATTNLRPTGIPPLGDLPWGTHFCHFYETRQDLLDILVPYLATGLQSNEFCLWVVSDPLTKREAEAELKRSVPDFERFRARGSIEMISGHEFYREDGSFDLRRAVGDWNEKLVRALGSGYAGMRVAGITAFVKKKDWSDFLECERALDDSLANQQMTALCSFPLAACGAAEILDVARTHQFTLARRNGSWEILETPELKASKEDIRRLNEDLERRVTDQTRQLTESNEALRREMADRQRAEGAMRNAQTQLAHAMRVSTMGELVASIAHELSQPLAAIVTNGNACLRWLGGTAPNLEEAEEAAGRIVEDANRAGQVIRRVRALVTKTAPIEARLDVNDLVRETIALLHYEMTQNLVVLRTDLAPELPALRGDRVQLQQVLLNLILNAIEAMSAVRERPRVLAIGTQRSADGYAVEVAVRDSGSGVPPQDLERIFETFFTTKADGMGFGLSIARSIIEAHGGQLRVTPNDDQGATFRFTIPVRVEDRR